MCFPAIDVTQAPGLGTWPIAYINQFSLILQAKGKSTSGGSQKASKESKASKKSSQQSQAAADVALKAAEAAKQAAAAAAQARKHVTHAAKSTKEFVEAVAGEMMKGSSFRGAPTESKREKASDEATEGSSEGSSHLLECSTVAALSWDRATVLWIAFVMFFAIMYNLL
jgi:multidrug efflux pump subunit AcrA (membrane-fusion protein)